MSYFYNSITVVSFRFPSLKAVVLEGTHFVSCANWNSRERLLSRAVLISCLSCFSEHLRRSTSCKRLFNSLWASARLLRSCSPCIRRLFTWNGKVHQTADHLVQRGPETLYSSVYSGMFYDRERMPRLPVVPFASSTAPSSEQTAWGQTPTLSTASRLPQPGSQLSFVSQFLQTSFAEPLNYDKEDKEFNF